MSYSVRVPKEPDTLIVEATTDISPFGGEVTATQEVTMQ